MSITLKWIHIQTSTFYRHCLVNSTLQIYVFARLSQYHICLFGKNCKKVSRGFTGDRTIFDCQYYVIKCKIQLPCASDLYICEKLSQFGVIPNKPYYRPVRPTLCTFMSDSIDKRCNFLNSQGPAHYMDTLGTQLRNIVIIFIANLELSMLEKNRTFYMFLPQNSPKIYKYWVVNMVVICPHGTDTAR